MDAVGDAVCLGPPSCARVETEAHRQAVGSSLADNTAAADADAVVDIAVYPCPVDSCALAVLLCRNSCC